MSSTVDKSSSVPQGATIPRPTILPLGYIWLNSTVEIDPQQAERIREIFRQYVGAR